MGVNFDESIFLILTDFGVHFSFIRRCSHVHFCRICNDTVKFFFFNCEYHTFRLIFSFLMRAISLKSGLEFAYQKYVGDTKFHELFDSNKIFGARALPRARAQNIPPPMPKNHDF